MPIQNMIVLGGERVGITNIVYRPVIKYTQLKDVVTAARALSMLKNVRYPDATEKFKMPNDSFVKSQTLMDNIGYITFTFNCTKSPSAVLDDIFGGQGECIIDCSVAVQIILFRAAQQTLGNDQFNALIKYAQRNDMPSLWIGKQQFLAESLSTETTHVLSPREVMHLQLQLGDVVYFRNSTEYAKGNPDGLWRGIWVIHLGDNIFGGLFGDCTIKHGEEIVSLMASQLSSVPNVVLLSDLQIANCAPYSAPKTQDPDVLLVGEGTEEAS